MKKLNEVMVVEAFEVVEIEEKLDFGTLKPVDNNVCPGDPETLKYL